MAGKRREVGATIGSFSHFGGADAADEETERAAAPTLVAAPEQSPEAEPEPREEGPLAEVDSLLGRDGVQPPPAAPARRSATRRRTAATTRRADVQVPDRLMSDLKEIGRPERTGAERTIGAKFFIAVYAQAVNQLLGQGLDVSGLDRGQEDEAVQRVCDALAEHFGHTRPQPGESA